MEVEGHSKLPGEPGKGNVVPWVAIVVDTRLGNVGMGSFHIHVPNGTFVLHHFHLLNRVIGDAINQRNGVIPLGLHLMFYWHLYKVGQLLNILGIPDAHFPALFVSNLIVARASRMILNGIHHVKPAEK